MTCSARSKRRDQQPRHPSVQPRRRPGVVALGEVEGPGWQDQRRQQSAQHGRGVGLDVAVVHGDDIAAAVRPARCTVPPSTRTPCPVEPTGMSCRASDRAIAARAGSSRRTSETGTRTSCSKRSAASCWAGVAWPSTSIRRPTRGSADRLRRMRGNAVVSSSCARAGRISVVDTPGRPGAGDHLVGDVGAHQGVAPEAVQGRNVARLVEVGHVVSVTNRTRDATCRPSGRWGRRGPDEAPLRGGWRSASATSTFEIPCIVAT